MPAVDFTREVARLVAELRERDADPRCASWPIEDAYGRISHVNTGKDTDKPIVQLFFTLRDMLTRDVRLGDTFTDTNRSAWKEDGVRPGWDAVVERLISGESHGVASVMIDRMMRQSWTLENLLRQHKRAHGRARSFTLYDVDSEKLYRADNIDDVDALRDKVKKSEYDSAVKSRKILRSNEARRLAGNDKNGPAPFGHAWGNEKDPDRLAAEREAVRDGMALVIDGKGWGHVADLWNSRGLTRRNGEPWYAQKVRQVLVLPRHAGYVRHGDAIVEGRTNVCEAIVSRETFDRFRRKIDKRSKGRAPAEPKMVDGELVDSPHFMSRILLCGACGTPMTGSFDKRRRGGVVEAVQVYRCPPRGCSANAIDGAAAHLWAARFAGRTLTNPQHVSMIARQRHDLTELVERIAEHEAVINTILATVEATTNPTRRAMHESRLAAYEAKLSPLLEERDALMVAVADGTAIVAADPTDFAEEWNAATPSERRQLAEAAFPDGVWVTPVGRGAWLRGEDIMTRLSLIRGAANMHRGTVCGYACETHATD